MNVIKADCLFSGNRLDSIQINVCVKGGACKLCGSPEAVAGGQWSAVACKGGPIKGNEIQLINPSTYLQFCELKVYGQGTRFDNVCKDF